VGGPNREPTLTPNLGRPKCNAGRGAPEIRPLRTKECIPGSPGQDKTRDGATTATRQKRAYTGWFQVKPTEYTLKNGKRHGSKKGKVWAGEHATRPKDQR